ncbi:neurofilament heavy polypeptide-like isoform X2 [Neocloeon triangulifer]|uniref:neurofilament heavy polypeptide-like isoform X2 n=1 Tax=Neocloeon triangulifer TaxID=2078957 RepID=UPI00286F0810|nr:neurofilament heavy polypeptide-like isoform X2 [Neocloeon triangulifer]
MEGGETKKNVPYFVIKVNNDGTITQTKQTSPMSSPTKPHIIRTPEKRTKDGRAISIEQKDSLGSSTIKIHEPVGTSAASMLSNVLVEAELPTSKGTKPLIVESKAVFNLVTAKQATLVRKSLGLPKINVPSKLVLVKPGMGNTVTTTAGPQIFKIQPQTTTVRQVMPKQSRKTPLTARTTDDGIIVEGEANKPIGSQGIIIQVSPASTAGPAQKVKITSQKVATAAAGKKGKVEQSTSGVQIIKTVQEIKPKVSPVVRQVIKQAIPITSKTTTVPIPLPIKGTSSPVKVVIVKEGMQPKPIAPKPAPMTISLVPPPVVGKTSLGTPIKIAPAPGAGVATSTAQRVVQIVPGIKKLMGPVIKLPERTKLISSAVVSTQGATPVAPAAAAPKGRGRGRGKAAAQTKEAPAKVPGKLAVVEAIKPETKPPSPEKEVISPAEVEVVTEVTEEVVTASEPAKPVGRRGKRGAKAAEIAKEPNPKEAAVDDVKPEPVKEEPPVAVAAPARRPGRPKRAAPEPVEVQKVEEVEVKADEPASEPAPAATRGRGRAPKKAAEPEKATPTPAKKAKIEEKKLPEPKQPEPKEVEKKQPEQKQVEKKQVEAKKVEKKSAEPKKAEKKQPEPKPVEKKQSVQEEKKVPEPKAPEPPKKRAPAAKKETVTAQKKVEVETPKKSGAKQIPEDKGYLFSRPAPPGWSRDVTQRKSGASAGKYDIYVFSPDGLKHRSRADIHRYLTLNKGKYPGITPEDFDFSIAKETPKGKSDTKEVQEELSKTKAAAKKVSGKASKRASNTKLVVSLPPKRTRK